MNVWLISRISLSDEFCAVWYVTLLPSSTNGRRCRPDRSGSAVGCAAQNGTAAMWSAVSIATTVRIVLHALSATAPNELSVML